MALPAIGALLARLVGGSAVRGALSGGQSAPVTLPTNISTDIQGAKEIDLAFRALSGEGQKKVMRAALKKGAKRIQERIIQNLSGAVVQVRGGDLREAFRGVKIISRARRGRVTAGVLPPTRQELGISEGDPNYYPYAIEYGHANAPPYPYIRPAVDDDYDGEVNRIREDVGEGIDRLFKRAKR